MLPFSLKDLFPNGPFPPTGTLVGVGMTAFSRIVPAYFLQNYHIVALRRTSDSHILERRIPLFCLEEESPDPLPENGMNSARLLSHPLVVRHLRGLPRPISLFLYQSYPEIEDLARREGWQVLANPSSLRGRLVHRAFFLDLAGRLELETPPGRIVSEAEVHGRDYRDWQQELGASFVVQLADIVQGGGRGTFFIRSPDDYRELRERLRTHTWRGSRISQALLRRYVEGTPASIAACIMDEVILQSRLQEQLIDLPFAAGIEKGVFCGHTWGHEPWPRSVEAEAHRQGRLVAGVLQDMGYRGILGIDFMVSFSGDVFPLEINPRLTGAFPPLSLFHMAAGRVPMEALHLAALSRAPCRLTQAEADRLFDCHFEGSHVLLFDRGGPEVNRLPPPVSGLYRIDRGGSEAALVEQSSEVDRLKDPSQFLLVEGREASSSFHSGSADPLARTGRLLFSFPAVAHGGGLRPEVILAINWFYGRRSGGVPGS